MQKYIKYLFVFLFVASIAACGGGGTTAATVDDKLPTAFASYSSLPDTPRGGAIQWGAISTNAKFTNYSVSTFSGSEIGIAGFRNYSTNSGSSALFNQPLGITTDGTSLYVADYNNHAIRQIDLATKIVSIFAGNGIVGRTNGIGMAASFYNPTDVTTDGKNLYVADFNNNSVRVINIDNHEVTTIGSVDGLAGSVDSTIPADVRFNHPTGITTDGINIYVADYGNSTVRRIDISNNYAVYTLAGVSGSIGSADDSQGIRGAARFNGPARITTDGKNLYLTDFNNRTIRQIEIKSGIVTTLAGRTGPLGTDVGTDNGIGAAAHFYQPNGITTDGVNLYVTDLYQNTIRKVVIATGYVETIAGKSGTSGEGSYLNGTGLDATFYNPVGITTDGTSLYVADSRNNAIRKLH